MTSYMTERASDDVMVKIVYGKKMLICVLDLGRRSEEDLVAR